MEEVARPRWPELAGWFDPERPGPLIHAHQRRTGLGRCRVDGWPRPGVVLTELAGNYALRGDLDRLDPAELADVTGLVEAGSEWLPVLRAGAGPVGVWSRIMAVLPADAPATDPGPARRLGPGDAAALRDHDPAGQWISGTWGGPDGLAAAGVAHGAFADGRLVSVAVPFYLGEHYGDIGVVTEAGHRGRGLSTGCAAAVVADLRAAGRAPTWTTSPDNAASLAVATRLGFVPDREDVLYAVRVPIPT